MLKAIIADDEALSIDWTRRLLKKHKDLINVIDTAENGLVVIDKVNKLKPDLIFLDIQMPGLTGIEAAKQFSHKPLVIFITAFDDYALQAFETYAVDYLMKPFDQDRMDLAIEKLQNFINTKVTLSKTVSDNKEEKISQFQIKIGNQIYFVPVTEICYFRAEEKYSVLYTKDSNYTLSFSLTDLEKQLPVNFYRAHRSCLVNLEKIDTIKRKAVNNFVVCMKEPTLELPLSRFNKDDIVEKLAYLTKVKKKN